MQTALSPDAPGRPRVDNRRALVCVLAICAGFVNLALALGHLGVDESYAVVLIVLGAAQVLWAVALYRSPSKRLLGVGAIANVAVALWFGIPTATHGAFGPLDMIAAGDELVLAVGAVVVLLSARRGHVAKTLRALTAVTGLFFVLMSSIVLAAPQGHVQGRRGGIAGLQYGDLTFYCPLGRHRLAHQ